MLSSAKKKVLRGSAANLLQLVLSFGVSLIVPRFLVHHMQQAEYSAWVLILQVSAYINYLEIGIQTAIGKYVAEYHAVNDVDAIERITSTAFSILSIAALIGIAAMWGMALAAPRIFHQMPLDVVGPVRLGIVAIGCSTALMLPFSVLQAGFVGLQRYAIPATITITGRIVSSLGIIALLLLHGSLRELALLVAGFNLLTVFAQWLSWKRLASDEVPLRFFLMDRAVALRLLEYCGVLSIWTIGSLFISGLDTTIVGRYDFRNTGFYGVAISATNFMLLILGNVLGPLMPAISSVHSQRTAAQLGSLLIRATRYSTLLLMLLAIPLFVGGYPLLLAWLGPTYALGSVRFMTVLVLANVLRQIGYPYALMVVATGSQRLATMAPILESIVNLTASLTLVRRFGAIGVAYGTLIGAVVGLCVHLFVSMRLTMPTILLKRIRLLLQGVMRPAVCALPTLLLSPLIRRDAVLPLSPLLLVAWALATLSIAWFSALTPSERHLAMARARAYL